MDRSRQQDCVWGGSFAGLGADVYEVMKSFCSQTLGHDADGGAMRILHLAQRCTGTCLLLRCPAGHTACKSSLAYLLIMFQRRRSRSSWSFAVVDWPGRLAGQPVTRAERCAAKKISQSLIRASPGLHPRATAGRPSGRIGPAGGASSKGTCSRSLFLLPLVPSHLFCVCCDPPSVFAHDTALLCAPPISCSLASPPVLVCDCVQASVRCVALLPPLPFFCSAWRAHCAPIAAGDAHFQPCTVLLLAK